MLLKEDLTAFLDARGASSMAAYLGPVDEPLTVALERRVTWAEEHRGDADARISDESAFLLTHADALRTLAQFGHFDEATPEPEPEPEPVPPKPVDLSALTRMEDLTHPPKPPRDGEALDSKGILRQGDELLADIRRRSAPLSVSSEEIDPAQTDPVPADVVPTDPPEIGVQRPSMPPPSPVTAQDSRGGFDLIVVGLALVALLAYWLMR